MRPVLFTFDIFGTVVDWRRGLEQDLAREGRGLGPGDIERVMDAQARDEQLASATVLDLVELSRLARGAG
jgi:hypothetical protein